MQGRKKQKNELERPAPLRVYGSGLDLLEVEEIQVSTALGEEELARRQ